MQLKECVREAVSVDADRVGVQEGLLGEEREAGERDMERDGVRV